MQVFRPGVANQAVLGIVGDSDRLLRFVKNLDCGEWPEYFLLANPQGVTVNQRYGRFYKIARSKRFDAITAGQDFSAFCPGQFHVGQHFFQLCREGQRTDFSRRVHRIAHPDIFCPFDEMPNKAIRDTALHQDAGSGNAHLSVVAEDINQRAVDRAFQVRIVEHDVG